MLHPSSQSSMRFFHEALFFLRCLFTFSSHCSQVYPHSQIIHSLPSLLHMHPSVALCFVSTLLLVSFVLGYWLATLPSSESLVLFVRCFLSSHVTTTLCYSPMPARFFHCCSCLPHCITFSPFTLRRASHLKPLNICYSPSPSFHCKIYTSFVQHSRFLLVDMIVNIHSIAYSVAIRVSSDKHLITFPCTFF